MCIYIVSRKVTPSACYNFRTHEPILMIFSSPRPSPPLGRGAENCDEHVRLYVCLQAYLRNHVSPIFARFSGYADCDRCLVLLWRRCNMSCMFGFVDAWQDVMFARSRPGKGATQLGRSRKLTDTAGGQHGIGPVSDIYHCLVGRCVSEKVNTQTMIT